MTTQAVFSGVVKFFAASLLCTIFASIYCKACAQTISLSPKFTVAHEKYQDYPSLASDGQFLLVGLYDFAPDPSSAPGSVAIYKRQNHTWTRLALIEGGEKSITGRGATFGQSLAVSDNILAIGEPGWNKGRQHGAIHVYSLENNSWVNTALLTLPRHFANYDSLFGENVLIQNRQIIASATAAASSISFSKNNGRGEVYIFSERRNKHWHLLETLHPPIHDDVESFGEQIASNGSLLAVSAYQPAKSGIVFIYRYNEGKWNYLYQLTPNSGDRSTSFGETLSLGPHTLFAGGYKTTGYIYDIDASGARLRAKISKDNLPATSAAVCNDEVFYDAVEPSRVRSAGGKNSEVLNIQSNLYSVKEESGFGGSMICVGNELVIADWEGNIYMEDVNTLLAQTK